MKNPYPSLALWFILTICMSSCAHQKEQIKAKDKTIASLSIIHMTPKLVQDRRFTNLISSQPGSLYSEEKISNDIKSLWESGLFDDVKFSAKTAGDSVDLVASISTRRPIGPPLIIVVGNTHFSEHTLWKQISKPHADRISRAMTVIYDPVTDELIVHRDDQLVTEVLPAVCDELESFYRSKGFQTATVTTRSVKGVLPNTDDFVFVIDEHTGE